MPNHHLPVCFGLLQGRQQPILLPRPQVMEKARAFGLHLSRAMGFALALDMCLVGVDDKYIDCDVGLRELEALHVPSVVALHGHDPAHCLWIGPLPIMLCVIIDHSLRAGLAPSDVMTRVPSCRGPEAEVAVMAPVVVVAKRTQPRNLQALIRVQLLEHHAPVVIFGALHSSHVEVVCGVDDEARFAAACLVGHGRRHILLRIMIPPVRSIVWIAASSAGFSPAAFNVHRPTKRATRARYLVPGAHDLRRTVRVAPLCLLPLLLRATADKTP
mmetsp:Transcript_61344/g.143483  ORF Transcript_61344/g.143483 Transcript_61344/m.143483 type:complete len:272 (-) Transcript_61344:297-1112(-)